MRLSLALTSGLTRPAHMVAFKPPVDYDFNAISTTIIDRNACTADVFSAMGHDVAQQALCGETTLVYAQRSKALTHALIEQAARHTRGWVVVDGTKRDGIDSIYCAIKKRGAVSGNITKAHGRLFWFKDIDLSDWAAPPITVDGMSTYVGLFSSKQVDVGSAILAKSLPEHLGDRVADFGAGWGFLSREILARDVAHLTAIEAELDGVEAIKRNLNDPRLEVIWGDATKAKGPFDTVVTNPPFHQGRADEPALGLSFIKAAAQTLNPRGNLWLVANRHLPYEGFLAVAFNKVKMVTLESGFKVFHAREPRRNIRP